jgi:cbb3-type cytochrome oxidase subunit 3
MNDITILTFAATIFFIVFLVLLICIPFFILRIRNEVIKINQKMDLILKNIAHPPSQ